MTTVEIKLELSDDMLRRLQREAKHRKIPMDAVVRDALEDYFYDPSEEEILAGLKRSMEQVLAGDYRPAHEVLDEIEHEMRDDADES